MQHNVRLLQGAPCVSQVGILRYKDIVTGPLAVQQPDSVAAQTTAHLSCSYSLDLSS